MYIEGFEDEGFINSGRGGGTRQQPSPTAIDLTGSGADLSGFSTRGAG